MEWQPIESAKKIEGKRIILGFPEDTIEPLEGFWNGWTWQASGEEKDDIPNPTHWMPFPNPPKENS